MSSAYTTLCDESTLYAAWNHIRTKGASGGIDGVTIDAFHEIRRKEIPRLAQELRDGTKMMEQLAKIVIRGADWVNIYPICTECYARIRYIPDTKQKEPVKIVVV